MGIDTAAVLDTKYAYDVAVAETTWRDDYSRWEAEKLYRDDQYASDTAYRSSVIAYNTAKEDRRFYDDVQAAYTSLASNRSRAVEIQGTIRQENAEAEVAAEQEFMKARDKEQAIKMRSASFGSGRSTAQLMLQTAIGGSDNVSTISLMAEMKEDMRLQQIHNLGVDAVGRLNSISEKVYAPDPKAVAKPLEYDAPIYIKPLEPNLEAFPEGGATEDAYIGASPEDVTSAFVKANDEEAAFNATPAGQEAQATAKAAADLKVLIDSGKAYDPEKGGTQAINGRFISKTAYERGLTDEHNKDGNEYAGKKGGYTGVSDGTGYSFGR